MVEILPRNGVVLSVRPVHSRLLSYSSNYVGCSKVHGESTSIRGLFISL